MVTDGHGDVTYMYTYVTKSQLHGVLREKVLYCITIMLAQGNDSE